MRSAHGIFVFLRSMVDNPTRIGAVLPSSSALARLMAKQIRLSPGEAIVEIGAGTGVVTAALLEAGVPRDALYVVELDPRLAEYLRKRFPGVEILQGDAAKLPELLPAHRVGRIASVVSSLPIRPMPKSVQKSIVEAAFAVMKPQGNFIQYTYPPFSPLRDPSLNIRGTRLGRIWANVPPAAVWRFQKQH